MIHQPAEDILADAGNRFVIFPIKYPAIWAMYKKAEASFWTAEEIDLAKDQQDWVALTENERFFVSHVLAFFAASDGIVNYNLGMRFSNEVMVPEAKFFYGFQIAMENVHSETYALLIDTYIKNTEEKARLLNAIHTIPCVAKKAAWALQWIEGSNADFATRLVAFACVEGIFFSGAFCAIYWLKERGIMPGLCFSNELISRDESMHTDFAVLLYTTLKHRMSQDRIEALFKDAVAIEKEFIVDSIPCRMLGMNADLMCQYIEFVADRLILQLGYAPIWNVRCPFDFMDRIGLSNKTNFFEGRVAEYSKAGVGATSGKSEMLELDTDF